MPLKTQNIAIIGAGMAGLSLANMLRDRANITVFEQAQVCGGRLATLYNKDYAFDYGAQFFTAKTDSFRKFIQPLIDAGIVGIWHAKFVEIVDGKITYRKDWGASYPHYVGIPGMDSICNFLAKNINVHCSISVKSIAKANHSTWQLFDIGHNHLGDFDWVISSTPVWEAQKLLPKAFSYHNSLQSIQMLGCYAMMLSFQNKPNVDWDVALLKDSNLSWIAFNSSKPARNTSTSLVTLARNKWAEENMETDLETIKTKMLDTLLSVIQVRDEGIVDLRVHRWEYANVGKNNQFKYLLDQESKLGAIGDWCIQGRVENAFISAHQLYNRLLHLL